MCAVDIGLIVTPLAHLRSTDVACARNISDADLVVFMRLEDGVYGGVVSAVRLPILHASRPLLGCIAQNSTPSLNSTPTLFFLLWPLLSSLNQTSQWRSGTSRICYVSCVNLLLVQGHHSI